MIRAFKNISLTGKHGKAIATDIFLEDSSGERPVIVYAHGFNGFKDWGNFDLVAERFAAAGFTFVKFNFAFNGTTPDAPEDFTDLEAFGQNNFTKELEDVDTVINWICSIDNPYVQYIDKDKIGLLGHSMGGGVVMIKGAEDDRVKAIAGWAAINACKTPWGGWPEEKMQEWEKKGVQYITNGRTRQEMPLYYQLYEDYRTHRERLDIETALRNLKKPLLLCHGSADSAVPVAGAYLIQSWKPDADLFILDTDHVFGRRHPWEGNQLPDATVKVVERTIGFFTKVL